MSKPTLHMIGNAHIDPVWLWQWQEGFQEVKATFRSALDRMNEYDDFVFVSSSAQFYEWVENNDPAMFAQIKQRIEEGRWEIVGGWWIQPDCNIPGGESFVRQGLYGQHYFQEKLGKIARVGYNVDSFGHNGMLPQILRKSGMDSYVFLRPGPHEKGLPGHLFWWESDDGSRVLASRILFEYCTWGKDLEKHIRRCGDQLNAPVDELMCFYGVGNHGGGPTKENLDSIIRMNDHPAYPALPFSTPNRFVASILERRDLNLPVVHEDLQHHASGCYAAHSGIKRWNRKAENAMIAAEKFAQIANWTTAQPYPKDAFKQAWKDILFNQFHDILAGTSIEPAYDDALYLFGEAMAIAGRGLNNAVQSLSWNIDIPAIEGMKPIVVFNPHAWNSKVKVELELGGFAETARLVDDTGHVTAIQRIQSRATAHGRNRICFVADLPPLGYRVYQLLPNRDETIAPLQHQRTLSATDTVLENDWFKLEFDAQTGFIKDLHDKNQDFSIFRGDAAKAVVIEDKSDTWSHGVFQFQNEAGRFLAKSVKLVELGDVRAVIRVISEFDKSVLMQDFTMYRDLLQIDVHVTVDWHQQFQALKLRFPITVNFSKATYEIPYGHIERAVNGEEEPGQSWIDMTGIPRETGELYGISILNDGKYSFDVLNREMSITVLRSPIYAHHDPFVPQEDEAYTFIDTGIQKFTYSLLPHEGSWQQAGTVQRALELNQPPVAVIETYHAGSLPQADSFVSVDADNVIISVVKQAEDNDDLVIRCYEAHGRQTDTTIRLPRWGREISLEFGPSEIKTIRVPLAIDHEAYETDLLEWKTR
ncbi:alpha-mannosidase [Alicyclobacillus curvatus]|nr:alpha-mannosidase [Alicyclobacillus curvatus]